VSRLLLDTHLLLRAVSAPQKLSLIDIDGHPRLSAERHG
jgi:hypothetical protein